MAYLSPRHFTSEEADISQVRLAAVEVAKGTGGRADASSLGVDSCGLLTPVPTLAQWQLFAGWDLFFLHFQ